MSTPYGTTYFSTRGNDGVHGIFDRTINITNALGHYASSQIPTNTPVGTLDTSERQERNTFYWNARQFASYIDS